MNVSWGASGGQRTGGGTCWSLGGVEQGGGQVCFKIGVQKVRKICGKGVTHALLGDALDVLLAQCLAEFFALVFVHVLAAASAATAATAAAAASAAASADLGRC